MPGRIDVNLNWEPLSPGRIDEHTVRQLERLERERQLFERSIDADIIQRCHSYIPGNFGRNFLAREEDIRRRSTSFSVLLQAYSSNDEFFGNDGIRAGNLWFCFVTLPARERTFNNLAQLARYNRNYNDLNMCFMALSDNERTLNNLIQLNSGGMPITYAFKSLSNPEMTFDNLMQLTFAGDFYLGDAFYDLPNAVEHTYNNFAQLPFTTHSSDGARIAFDNLLDAERTFDNLIRFNFASDFQSCFAFKNLPDAERTYNNFTRLPLTDFNSRWARVAFDRLPPAEREIGLRARAATRNENQHARELQHDNHEPSL